MFRIITGIIVLLFGLWLVYALYPEGWWATLYGLFVAGIGVAILMNKKEDEIEEITGEEDQDN
jgi:thiol:disulfide interchange protein